VSPARLRATACCLLAGFVLAAGRLAAAETPVLRVLMEEASPPFAARDATAQPEGFAVDLMRAVAADQGFRVEFDLRPWPEVYADFQRGKGDILGLVAWSEERAAQMDFSLPFERLVGGVYSHRDKPKFQTLEELRGKRIAVRRNAITQEFARRQPWATDLRIYENLGECLQAVDRGECDAMLGTQLVTDHQIRKLGLTKVVRCPIEIPGIDYRLCFAVQPGHKELLARINAGLYHLQASRQHDALHEKWLGPLEPQRLLWRDLEPWLPLATFIAMAVLGVLLWQRGLLARLSRQARAIRESEERLQLVFEGSQDAFWDWDVTAGRILRSPRWAGMLGYAPEEIGPTRDSFQDKIHPEDRARVAALVQQLWDGQDQFHHEFRLRAKSGKWRWILDRGKVVSRDPATGAPRRITGTHTDITERKLAEAEAEKLRQKMLEAQKLESLGVLAGGIAHDFNNLLTVIIGNGTLARLEAGETPANQARLDSVLTSARRAAELCHQLLAFAGKGSFTTARINLNDLVNETARLLEISIGRHARLEFALAPDLPPNEADPSQIRQVIMNLLINASEALAGRPGTIRLATSAVTVGPAAPGSGSAWEIESGAYVCLEVADTGEGMTAAVRERIFDPFYSTKFTGRGLGLAAVLGIVRMHHGSLKVDSTPGRGSVFRVLLPVVQRTTVHPFPSPEDPAGAPP
jgi:PAS domain S-box-containing protein